jgi:hypothetical protein
LDQGHKYLGTAENKWSLSVAPPKTLVIPAKAGIQYRGHKTALGQGEKAAVLTTQPATGDKQLGKLRFYNNGTGFPLS